ncbi:hypothetical protein SUDANB105_04189 [Streptomyces sp. enrichment culture]
MQMNLRLPGESHSAVDLQTVAGAAHRGRHPDIADVAVIGLTDADRGELVCAVAEQPPGARELTLDALTSHLRAEGLSVHKLPERLEVVDALPRGETLRKVLKYKLRERYSGTVK